MQKLKNIFCAFLAVILCFSGFTFSPITAQAATSMITEMTDTSILPDTSENIATFKSGDYSYSKGSGGTNLTTVTDSGVTYFMIPIKDTGSSWSITDVMTITETDICSFNGRSIDMAITIDEIDVGEQIPTVTSTKNSTWYHETGDNFAFMTFNGEGTLSFGTSSNTYGYCAVQDITYTVTMTYDDTNEVVDVPFFPVVSDIDSPTSTNNTLDWGYISESVTFYNSDFQKYYVYDGNIMNITEGSATTKFASSGTLTDGDESYTLGGVIGVTNTGTWTVTMTVGKCGNTLRILSNFPEIPNPVKTTDTSHTYSVGDEVNYSVTQDIDEYYVTTYATYSSLVFTDKLPDGLSYKDGSLKMYSDNEDVTRYGTTAYDSVNNILTFTFGDEWLDDEDNYSGQTLEMDFTATIEGLYDADKTTVTNTAYTTISGVEYGPTTVDIDVLQPKLSISKEADASTYSVGDTVTYTIKVSQTVADTTAENVVITDSVPSSLELKTVTSSDVSSSAISISGNTFTVKCGSLSYNSSVTLTVTATATTAGTGIKNTAYADADNADEVSDDVTITVVKPALSISKTADAETYYPGDTVTYSIVVKQTVSDAVAKNVVVSDTVPSGLELKTVTSSDTNDTVSIDGNAFTVSCGSITTSDTTTITVTATALEAAANTEVVNTATATSDNTDPTDDDETVEIIKPILSITKDSDKTTYYTDEQVTYTIDVKQTLSGLTASNVVVSDTLPDGLTISSVTATKGATGTVNISDDSSFTVTYGSLAYGTTAEIVVVADIDSSMAGETGVKNTAYADADHADEVDDDTDIDIIDPAKLKLTKSSANDSVTDGNDLYTLEGAVYYVYTDSGCNTQAVDVDGNKAVLTTTSDGSTNTIELHAGTYYIKEYSASTGYELDTAVHTVTVTDGDTVTFDAEETPQMDTVGLTITKTPEETDGWTDSSLADLSGARFTIKYYAGDYSSISSLPGTATRTWVIETSKDSSGAYTAVLDKAHLVSGSDELYYDNNEVVIPLGTVTIEETRAPYGYTTDGTYSISGGSAIDTEDGVVLLPVSGLSGGTVRINYCGTAANSDVKEDTPRLGSITLTKLDSNGDPLSGVTYTLEAIDSGSGESTVITEDASTDGNGKVVFEDLAYGTYRITETGTQAGQTLLAEPITVEIPLVVTPAEVKSQGLDTGKAYYDEVDDMYYFTDLSYEVTDDANLVLPMTGGLFSGPIAILIITGAVLLGVVAIVTFRRKRRVA